MKRLTILAGLLIATGLYVRLFERAIIDDAFISLKYSAMLVEHGTWGFLPGRVSNTATSPLNVLATALVGYFSASMTGAVLQLAAAELFLLCILLVRISRKLFGHAYFGGLSFIALAANPLLTSTIGLEGMLFTLLLVWSIDLYLARQWTLLGVALGLATLARPDGALLVLAYFMFAPIDRRVYFRFCVAYAMVMTPWLLFSWVHLGSLLPDTLQIKMGQRGWGRGLTLWTGLALYLDRFPVEMVAAFALLPFVVFAWMGGRNQVATVATVLTLYAILHMVGYSLLGVPPYHWYYVSQVVPVALVGSLGLTALIDSRWRAAAWPSRAGLASLVAVPAFGLIVSSVQLGVPLREAPIHTNWATHDEYKAAGEWLRDHVSSDTVIFNMGEMGTVSYHSGRLLVNEFSDANMTYRAVLERYPEVPFVVQVALDVNFLWRRMQDQLPAPSYRLSHVQLPNTEEERLGSRIVKTWDTSTRWMPRARLYFFRYTPGTEAR